MEHDVHNALIGTEAEGMHFILRTRAKNRGVGDIYIHRGNRLFPTVSAMLDHSVYTAVQTNQTLTQHDLSHYLPLNGH